MPWSIQGLDFEIRKDRRPQGPRRLAPEREEHLRLLDLGSGIGNTEACRIIGINRHTGKRRLHGRQAPARYRAALVDAGLPWQAPDPPARPEEPVGPSRHLTEADCVHIADRLREKPSVWAIATELAAAPPP